jgi:Rrf2 family protein
MFTETTLQAMRVVVYLAAHDAPGPVSHHVLAAQLCASETYLSKVITQLTKKGILATQRGRCGGAQLARAAEEITLLDVLYACEGSLSLAFHPAAPGEDQRLCPFHAAMLEFEEMIQKTLGGWTVADMVRHCGTRSVQCLSRAPCFIRSVNRAVPS